MAKNAIKKYPGNKYTEELSWIILQAKYQLFALSIDEKRLERARDAQDEYYNFVTEYPTSKHRKEAEKMAVQIRKLLND